MPDTRDIYVYSEDIYFTNENPDLGEEIDIVTYVHYYGSESASDVPVTIKDIFPVAGELKTFPISNVLVDFDEGSDSSPFVFPIPWTNMAEGAHIIQIVVEPPFTQFTGNDEATRLIFVGDPPPLQLTKDVVNAEGNEVFSPGDTLEYRITYENLGTTDVTGVVIVDDYDEVLLETPFQISNNGTIADGVITWNLGTLAAGTSSTVTYQVNIKPPAEFPLGRSTIMNYVLLDTEQMPSVGTSIEIEVIVNVPPTVDAGPDLVGNEGDMVTLTASGSDYDGDPLTYVWDLDDNGSFEKAGESVQLTLLDGSAQFIITVQVTDSGGLTATDQAIVEVLNVVPVAVFSNTSGIINEGESATLTFSDSFDPSTVDMAAGFLYSYDCTDDGTFELSDDPAVSFTCDYPDNGIFTARGRIVDKDGDHTDYTIVIMVNNVAPIATFAHTSDPATEGVPATLTFSAQFDPSPIDTAAGFLYSYDCTDDSQFELSDTVSASYDCHYPTIGTFTARGRIMDKDGDYTDYTIEVRVYTPLSSFVALGEESLWLGHNSIVVNGSVGANMGSNDPFLAQNEVVIGKRINFLDLTSRVMGDTIKIGQGTQLHDVYYNELRGRGQILGQHVTPVELPLVSAFPPVPNFTPGTEKIIVPKRGTVTVTPGNFGALIAGNNTTITFSGGIYNFKSWDIGRKVNIFFESPTEIRIAGRIRTGFKSYLGPAASATDLDATDILIFVTGSNSDESSWRARLKTVELGDGNNIIANIYAPNGTLWLGNRSMVTGSLLGRWVVISNRVTLTLANGW